MPRPLLLKGILDLVKEVFPVYVEELLDSSKNRRIYYSPKYCLTKFDCSVLSNNRIEQSKEKIWFREEVYKLLRKYPRVKSFNLVLDIINPRAKKSRGFFYRITLISGPVEDPPSVKRPEFYLLVPGQPRKKFYW